MPRQTSHEIDDEAAAWAARVDRAPLSAADEQALSAWLAGDVRCIGAYARARAIALHSERARALGAGFDPARFETGLATPAGPSRRGVLWMGGGAVAAGVAGLAGLVVLKSSAVQFNTRKGEVKVVPLADGSVLTLNTASRVAVSYSRARRDIRLIQGEVLFDVAKDPARPFLVAAGDTSVRAVGTSFTVRRIDDLPVQVLVREGVVEVRRGASSRVKPVRAAANTRVVAGTRGPTVATAAVAAVEVSRELSWREGRIAFEGETLRQAATEFSRYSDTRIVIDDPAIAGQEVTGLFQANDPVGFARAVASSFDLTAQVGADQVRLYRQAG